MTIRIEPHFRVQILPNVGASERDGGLMVFAELENTRSETVSSVSLVAVAYTEDGTLCAVEESNAYVTLREGERKALKIRLETEAPHVAAVRLYVETEYDEEDPLVADPAVAEPPNFMIDYFQRKSDKPQ